VRQRNLNGIVLMLGAGLLALSGRVPGQNAPTPPAPSAWAMGANEPVPAAPGGAAVIASSRPQVPGAAPETRVPAPDDNIKALMPKPPTAPVRPGPPAPLPPPPDPPPSGGVEPAVHVAPPPAPGTPDVNILPVAAPPVVREAPPALVAPAAPADGALLSLDVRGPGTGAPGQVMSYALVARNRGSGVLAGVRVELPVPDGARMVASEPPAERNGNKLSWNLGNLQGGSERVVKIDLAAGETGDVHVCPSASFGVAVGLRTNVIRPPFGLTVVGPEHATVGTSGDWNIQVSNNTDRPLRKVLLSCRLSAGLVHPQGESIETEVPDGLLPGKVHHLTLKLHARDPGRQVIGLSANADGEMSAQTQAVVLVSEVTLALTADAPRRARVGETLALRLSVNNPGGNASGPIHVTQVLPGGVEFASAGSGGVYNPVTKTIAWSLESVPGGGHQDVEFKVQARQMGDWALAAAVQAENVAEVRTTRAIHIAAAPALTLEMMAHDNPLAAGAETTYEVRIYNAGPAPAGEVRLRLILPDNLLAVQASAPTRWQIQGQQVLFDPVEQMRGRVAAVYRLRVRAVRAGMGRCRAELTADGMTKPIQQELAARVTDPQGTLQARGAAAR
jgi:uncharacterized repeat protein (TIGR01451 family)